MDWIDSNFFAYVVLPLLIFLSRVVDVTIDTLRLIFISKGFRTLAPVLGFFEVIIWLLAITQIMKHLDNFVCYIAYGGGFAMGNYVGMYIEEKLSIGNVIVRVITRDSSKELIDVLVKNNYGMTIVDAKGALDSSVKIIFSVVKREDLKKMIDIINEYNPNAFYSVEDVKTVKEGYFNRTNNQNRLLSFFKKRK